MEEEQALQNFIDTANIQNEDIAGDETLNLVNLNNI